MQAPACILATLLSVALPGCAGPSRDSLLDSMVGEDVDKAIETFGQPADVIDLDEGRSIYVWRRVYDFEFDSGAGIWPERRPEIWEREPQQSPRSRVCLTSLYIGFDFVVERWDYACRTEMK